MTFKAFMAHVDEVVGALPYTGGFGVHDFADAPWRDLYEETDGEADDAAIVETLAEYDDTFAAMVELGAPGDIL